MLKNLPCVPSTYQVISPQQACTKARDLQWPQKDCPFRKRSPIRLRRTQHLLARHSHIVEQRRRQDPIGGTVRIMKRERQISCGNSSSCSKPGASSISWQPRSCDPNRQRIVDGAPLRIGEFIQGAMAPTTESENDGPGTILVDPGISRGDGPSHLGDNIGHVIADLLVHRSDKTRPVDILDDEHEWTNEPRLRARGLV